MYPSSPYLPPPVPLPTRRRNRAPLLIGAGIALILVVAAAIWRFEAPTQTVKSFLTAALVNADGASATNDLCADQRGSSITNGIQPIPGTTVDISSLAIDLTSEGLTTAQVHVHGDIALTTTLFGLANTTKLPYDATFRLNANGVGWCIESAPGGA